MAFKANEHTVLDFFGNEHGQSRFRWKKTHLQPPFLPFPVRKALSKSKKLIRVKTNYCIHKKMETHSEQNGTSEHLDI